MILCFHARIYGVDDAVLANIIAEDAPSVINSHSQDRITRYQDRYLDRCKYTLTERSNEERKEGVR